MRNLAAALLIALAAWLIAVLALDAYLYGQGTADLTRVARGESRVSFEFDHARDLIGVHDEATQVHIHEGVLRAVLPGGRANLRFNLRGLALDAQRFKHLDARIELGAPANVLLIFDEPGQLQQHSFQVELPAGWQSLRLDLGSLPFRPLSGDGQTRAWGGLSGRIGEFRLYIAGPEDLALALDHLRFTEGAVPAKAPTIEWISADQARERIANSASLRGAARVGVRLDLLRDTPERNLQLRDQVRAHDSEALFWPAWRSLPVPKETPVAVRKSEFSAWAIAILWALLAVAIRWRWRAQGPAALELLIGYAPLAYGSIALGLAEHTSPPMLLGLLVALLFQISGLRIAGSCFLGPAPAWWTVTRGTALAALILGLIAVGSAHWQPADAERALQYLPFVALQQAILLGFLLPRCLALTDRGRLFACLLFGFAHAPNFALMLLSMIAAWAWLTWYQRYRAWLPILCSHYLLGLLAISALPPSLLYSAEIGLRYFQLGNF